MKKKLMMVAVLLGALSLGACVDDNESQSVTDVRKAKAEQLSALAAKAKAEAEAALITANAEKAYKEAWAKFYEAQAAYQNANTDRVLQEIEESKIRFEAELEAIKAEYEARLWRAKKEAAKAEQEMLDQADERLQGLYNTYFSALQRLNNLKGQKVEQEYILTQYKAELISANEYVATQTASYQAQIDEKTAELNAWKTYSGMDKADLKAQELELTQAKYKAFAAYQEKRDAADALEDAKEAALEVYDVNYEKKSPVAAVAAWQEFKAVNNYWIGSTWEEAAENTRVSMDQGLCSWEDIRSNSWTDGDGIIHESYTITAVEIYKNGQHLFVAPVKEEFLSLSEELYMHVPVYSLYNAKRTTLLTNHYATGKEGEINRLGSEASDNKLATGLYLQKENAENIMKDANEELTKAETDFLVKEKAYKTAKDAMDAAKKVLDDARKAEKNARAVYEETMNGTDTAAQEAARKALENAEKASQTANDQYIKASNTYNKAWSEYWAAEQNLQTVKEIVRTAAENLAGINDEIDLTKGWIEYWDENAAKWNAVVTALEDATYKTAVEGLSKNTDVTAYIAAVVAENEANNAYNEACNKVYAVNNLLWGNGDNVKDPAEEIRNLESEIAGLNTYIANLKNIWVNGLQSANNYEKLIAQANATIESLNSQIQVQEAIVKLAKERVEAAIAETPAE